MLLNGYNMGNQSPGMLTNPNSLVFKTTSQVVTLLIIVSMSPSILWEWSDGSTSTAANPGAKDFGSAATRFHTLTVSDWSLVTVVDFDATPTIAFNLSHIPRALTGQISLNLTDVFGQLKGLPSGLASSLFINITEVTGSIADIPRGLTNVLQMAGTAITGDIANLPPGLIGNILLQNSAVSAYTATAWPCATADGNTIQFQNLGLSESEVDNILAHLDTHGNINCTLTLSGNTAPSAAGLVSKSNLEAKGYTVTVDV